MKTRISFEAKDFEGMGQMLIRESSPKGSDNISFMSSVSYKVGYIVNTAGNDIAMISLEDGMISTYNSIEDLIERLNSDNFGFRPMTQEEINAVMQYQGNRFYEKS